MGSSGLPGVFFVGLAEVSSGWYGWHRQGYKSLVAVKIVSGVFGISNLCSKYFGPVQP